MQDGDFDYFCVVFGGLNVFFMSIYVFVSLDNFLEFMQFVYEFIDLVEVIVVCVFDKFVIVKSFFDVKFQFEKGLILLLMGMENGFFI